MIARHAPQLPSVPMIPSFIHSCFIARSFVGEESSESLFRFLAGPNNFPTLPRIFDFIISLQEQE